jgi:hypothetical protein
MALLYSSKCNWIIHLCACTHFIAITFVCCHPNRIGDNKPLILSNPFCYSYSLYIDYSAGIVLLFEFGFKNRCDYRFNLNSIYDYSVCIKNSDKHYDVNLVHKS